jgi:hypothetical protein
VKALLMVSPNYDGLSSICAQGAPAPSAAEYFVARTLRVFPFQVSNTSVSEDHAGLGSLLSSFLDELESSAGVELDSDEDDSCCCELEELDSSSPPQATTNGRSISNARISAKIFFKFLYLLNKFSNLHISP